MGMSAKHKSKLAALTGNDDISFLGETNTSKQTNNNDSMAFQNFIFAAW